MAPKNRNRNRNRGVTKPSKTVQAPKPTMQIPGQWEYQPDLVIRGSGGEARGVAKYGENWDRGMWVGRANAAGAFNRDAYQQGTKAFAQIEKEQGLTAAQRYDYTPEDKAALAAKWDAGVGAQQNQASQGGTMNSNPAMANNKISRGRIQSIMDQKGIKGRDQDRARLRITNRLAQRGGTLGIGAAKDYAKAYAARNPQEAMMQSMAGQQMRVGSSGMTRTIGSPSNDMSSRKGQKGALYRGIQSILDTGDYAKGDVLASLRSGDVRAQPFGTGAGGMGAGGGKKKGKNKRGGGGDTTMGADTGTTAMDQIEPMDMGPMSPEQMAEESSININMPTVADLIGNWASGYRTKRSSRKRAGSKAQGLSSQTVAPTGSWRYGT